MATKEIIEVDSSDEEAEPPAKKMKPVPNAMVHIPTRLPGISIKPTKKNSTNSTENVPSIVFLSKNITTKNTTPNATPKSNMLINPLVNKLKNNSVTVKKSNTKVNTVLFIKKPTITNQHPVKKITHAVINSPNSNRKTSNLHITRVHSQAPKQAGTSVLSNLPSSITIKKAPSSNFINLPVMPSVAQKKPKTKSKPVQSVNEILTVDLDDEEGVDQQPSTVNPPWYMRPEDSQNIDENIEGDNREDVNFEEQNNKEPETPKYVEIIIEDSPVKPAERQFNVIGQELPVIIEDSLCMDISNDEGKLNHIKKRADPHTHSKKKLNYPIEQQSGRQVVEIEIDPIDTTNMLTEHDQNSISEDHTKEPLKNNTEEKYNPPNKSENECQTKKEEPEQEFHSIYQKFIETCFEVENSDDMKKIVEKKIKAYYRQCSREYVESEEFIDMVASKTASIKAGPDKMYLYIKDIVDELNMQRKLVKQQGTTENVPKVPEERVEIMVKGGEYDTKKLRQIRKLEKTIKQLHRAIQKLEEQEVDLDDEENSMYLLTERYKERLVRVHAKFRQMTNTKMPSEPRIVIEARPGCPHGPANKLEKFINKKVPIGTPLPFPDFHDVLHCVRDANEEDGLGWSNMEIEAEARDLFERCGKKLKRRRQENEWRISVASRIPSDSQDKDPAEDNVELKKKLRENKFMAAKRESEILNKYADRQHQLKLEAEEIGDKEAEETGGESEEEEVADSHLSDKVKRKEILKKLIQEKNRKSSLSTKAGGSPDDAENSSENTNIEAQSSNIASANDDKLDSEAKKIPHESMDVDASNLNSNDNKEIESNVIDIDSDIDELHLLQKLRFEDEVITSSSDSDGSLIAISDSSESESDSENDKVVCSDIISIENSSYSESEALADEAEGTSNVAIKNSSKDTKDPATENLENSTLAGNKSSSKSSDGDSIENISLASSEDDATSYKDVNLGKNELCTNSKDDILSLTDTATEEENHNKDVDILKEVNENELKEIAEETQSKNDDCTVHKDGSEQDTLNDMEVATIDLKANGEKEANTDSNISEKQEKT